MRKMQLATQEKSGRRARGTLARKHILDSLKDATNPLSAADLLFAVSKTKKSVNKTTIYRQLTSLLAEGAIRELQLGEKKKRYELTPINHHHHLVCVRCEKIEHVELERDLAGEEKKIMQEKKFEVLTHSLEFFGRCAECRTT